LAVSQQGEAEEEWGRAPQSVAPSGLFLSRFRGD